MSHQSNWGCTSTTLGIFIYDEDVSTRLYPLSADPGVSNIGTVSYELDTVSSMNDAAIVLVPKHPLVVSSGFLSIVFGSSLQGNPTNTNPTCFEVDILRKDSDFQRLRLDTSFCCSRELQHLPTRCRRQQCNGHVRRDLGPGH